MLPLCINGWDEDSRSSCSGADASWIGPHTTKCDPADRALVDKPSMPLAVVGQRNRFADCHPERSRRIWGGVLAHQSSGAPANNHLVLGTPENNATATTTVHGTASHAGHATHAPASATACNENSILTRFGPDVATTTCFLSPGVENIAGIAIKTIATGIASQTLIWAAAQGPATHAITSTPKRDPPDRAVSYGETPGPLFMTPPAQSFVLARRESRSAV